MDESVIAAIARWPNVPAVYGWLRLTARGEWRLRGESIVNTAIVEFMGRNYAGDERGRWFFQNGPQRVYVSLEAAPWIWRIGGEAGVEMRSHTGRRARQLQGAWLDEGGRLFLSTDIGFGLLDSTDATQALGSLHVGDASPVRPDDLDAWLGGRGPCIAVDGAALGLQGATELGRLRFHDAPGRFGYVLLPQPD